MALGIGLGAPAHNSTAFDTRTRTGPRAVVHV